MNALLDPTAPVPAGWPTGGLGAFLLFLFPIGGGIPFGVIMAYRDGVSPMAIAFLYFLSDIVAAFTTEPMIIFIAWLSRRVPAFARIGAWLERMSGTFGLKDEGPRGPLGLIMLSFAVAPTPGRAAAKAAGHGFISGWSLAITGDMLYFFLLMGSTLWLSAELGNDRLAIGLVVGATWLLPLAIRWIRRRSTPTVPRTAAIPTITPPTQVAVPATLAVGNRAARRRKTRSGRR